VNYVAQHSTLWKLDSPLPGSKVCMYMHPAEQTGCRGVKDIGDLYRHAYDAYWHCRQDFVQAAEDYTQETCLKQQLARVVGCIIQEDSFLLAGGVSVQAMLAKMSLPEINTTALLTELTAIFSDSTVASRQEDIASLKAQTGITRTVSLTKEEIRRLQSERDAVKLEAGRSRMSGHAAVSERLDPRMQSVEANLSALPKCTGCEAEWCLVKDISHYRCCSVNWKGNCKSAPHGRRKCDDSESETCGGLGSWIKSLGARKCRCKAGTCWDSNEQRCKQDGSLQDRKRLLDDQRHLAQLKHLQNKWEDFSADEQTKAWEEKVVKMKTSSGKFDEDAKPDPSINGRWICSK